MNVKSEIGEIMYREALCFLNNRFPKGWGGCAVLRTEGGKQDNF